MAELTPQEMASKLGADGFARSGPEAQTLSDPAVDTPMVITLDQLRPYDHDPRLTRNPLYDDIKASIRERGLDAPPSITRRPGDASYMIRNGGNTRLAILRELWSETKEERFFRVACLFRPWSARGEIVALTGHLAENELHGGLSFIERALGVEKARELYEQETGQALSQSELARRLKADGLPIPQPHISRMHDAVQYLLPAIPNVLYGGLGRHQIGRLAALRKSGEAVWNLRIRAGSGDDFQALFQEVLATFDAAPTLFSVERVQDELVGQIADRLGIDYDTLTLELSDHESRQQVLASAPVPAADASHRAQTPPVPPPPAKPIRQVTASPGAMPKTPPANGTGATAPAAPGDAASSAASAPSASFAPSSPPLDADRLQGHIVSTAPTTQRLQSIQRMVADQLADPRPDFERDALRAIPVQAGGLYPISDVWYIDPGLDMPEHLRIHIAQFAHEMAEEAGEARRIVPTADGLGFVCDLHALTEQGQSAPFFARAVLTLLHALSTGYSVAAETTTALDNLRLADALGPLLQGRLNRTAEDRLSDSGLVKLFRLLRLARRLLELEAGAASHDST